ncbi:hypothetical protein FRB96_009263 [Tulasnella sp. 330]|nr:hypothetical protein FRB96_009263 [Tulasnella sp. 330]KAG8883497.1 hypothetical protein FRB97_006480 [Tulasnella sp. 331]KAG8889437.1 hypothetical protein FRB98_004333 [Tulasnella sp. 332]
MASATTLATSSATSFDGDYSFVHVSAEGGWADCWGKPPKTRKRITKEQLDMLEDLFRTNSHPSREERQMIAARTGMELRSVTIWLQNKRQLIKKNATKDSPSGTPAPSLPSRPSTPAVSARNSNPSDAASSRTLTPPATSETDTIPPTKLGNHPSLERVASLSEHPTPARDITIKIELDSAKEEPIWKHMPSSPPGSPPRPVPSKLPNRSKDSAPAIRKVAGRPYPAPPSRTSSVDSAVTSVSASASSSRRKRETERASYLKPGYTLEWACAQATKRQELVEDQVVKVGDEAGVQPIGCSASSPLSDATSHISETGPKPTDDEMQAALALCDMLEWSQ